MGMILGSERPAELDILPLVNSSSISSLSSDSSPSSSESLSSSLSPPRSTATSLQVRYSASTYSPERGRSYGSKGKYESSPASMLVWRAVRGAASAGGKGAAGAEVVRENVLRLPVVEAVLDAEALRPFAEFVEALRPAVACWFASIMEKQYAKPVEWATLANVLTMEGLHPSRGFSSLVAHPAPLRLASVALSVQVKLTDDAVAVCVGRECSPAEAEGEHDGLADRVEEGQFVHGDLAGSRGPGLGELAVNVREKRLRNEEAEEEVGRREFGSRGATLAATHGLLDVAQEVVHHAVQLCAHRPEGLAFALLLSGDLDSVRRGLVVGLALVIRRQRVGVELSVLLIVVVVLIIVSLLRDVLGDEQVEGVVGRRASTRHIFVVVVVLVVILIVVLDTVGDLDVDPQHSVDEAGPHSGAQLGAVLDHLARVADPGRLAHLILALRNRHST
ncbi:uncharacterized protein LOC62_01G000480 [Vanrija pseudolonga]|uniref:Uncharacterized protein n=1 Tax=Vanrija pseudolonga TaxID=143232 RepID=A0AAF0XZL3_9TREE|nr:hypothetical protein LOC62_01G000480 [Vanrija pseudolonga]